MTSTKKIAEVDYSMFEEDTWEFAAWKAIRENDLDVPSTHDQPFAQLYDSDLFAFVANKAWNLIVDGGAVWSVSDMVGLMARKQHDYGHANIDRFGPLGVKVRLWDKIARYQNLVSLERDPIAANAKIGGDATADSILDTLIDIIGYVTILFMVQRGTFANELAETDEDKGLA